MFDYIKIDEGANRLLMCILILAICWFLVKWKKRATLPFNVVYIRGICFSHCLLLLVTKLLVLF